MSIASSSRYIDVIVFALASTDCTPALGLLLTETFGSWGCFGSVAATGGEGGVANAFAVAFAFAFALFCAFAFASPFGFADDFAAVAFRFGGFVLAGADDGADDGVISVESALCGVSSNPILLLTPGALALFPGFPDLSEAEPAVDPNDAVDEHFRMPFGVSQTLCAFFWGVAASFNAAAAAKSFLFLKTWASSSGSKVNVDESVSPGRAGSTNHPG